MEGRQIPTKNLYHSIARITEVSDAVNISIHGQSISCLVIILGLSFVTYMGSLYGRFGMLDFSYVCLSFCYDFFASEILNLII